jgi:hypothetical protein
MRLLSDRVPSGRCAPVLIAATVAIAAPEFNLRGIQATTNPGAVWLIINGPIAKKLSVNSGGNCLGPGAWANATLGRAMRLIQQNIGGALAGEMDRATQGQPGKYTFCCAENEDGNPWEPLHVERGFARAASTVTVVGALGTWNMNIHAKDSGDLLTDSHFKRHFSPIGNLSLAWRTVNLVKIRSSPAVFPGIGASRRPLSSKSARLHEHKPSLPVGSG